MRLLLQHCLKICSFSLRRYNFNEFPAQKLLDFSHLLSLLSSVLPGRGWTTSPVGSAPQDHGALPRETVASLDSLEPALFLKQHCLLPCKCHTHKFAIACHRRPLCSSKLFFLLTLFGNRLQKSVLTIIVFFKLSIVLSWKLLPICSPS